MKKKIVTILTALLLMIVPVIPAMAADQLPSGTENLDFSFTTIDGEQLSSQANGKPKLLVFFKVNCPNCQNTLRNISNSDLIDNNDVYAFACSTLGDPDAKTDDASILSFKTSYCSSAGDKIKFAQGDYISLASQYNQATGAPANALMSTPVIAMVDTENNLCFVTQGLLSADDIKDYIPTLQASSGSGDSQKPGSSTDSKKDNKKDKKSTDSKPGCDHVAEYFTINDATSSDDALSAYQCIKCGAVLRYEAVPNSAYATFLADTANAILNAGQGEVTINTDIWTCFNRAVFDAIKSRPDVAVTVNYSYKGEPYVLHIPAGTNVDSLMDENGFGGFMYIQHVINTSK